MKWLLSLLVFAGCHPGQPKRPPTAATPYLDGCRQGLASARALRDRLLAARPPRTVDNTLRPLNDAQIDLTNTQTRARVYLLAHPDAALRGAAATCSAEADALETELVLSREIYDAVRAVDTSHAEPDTRRFQELVLRDARHQGVDRDDATRARLRELADRQQALARSFERAVQDEVAAVRIPAAVLEDLPEDYRRSHPAGADGQVEIRMQRPDVVPVLERVADAAARRAVFRSWTSLAWPANDSTLKHFLDVARERARLLGFGSTADHWLARNMLRDTGAVRTFLERFTATLRRRNDPVALLLLQKRRTEPSATSVEWWESAYLSRQVLRDQVHFDPAEMRPYFELQRTVQGVLGLTKRLYGLEYRRVHSDEAWHADVQSFDVFEGERRIARLHLDLHPRPGKTTIFSAHVLQAGVAGRQMPEATLIGNFPDARGSGVPTLLDQVEVAILAHELGHVMHQIFSTRQRWIRLHGYAIEEIDFIEGPSSVLEQFAWQPEALRTFAVHAQTGASIPDDLMRRMSAAHALQERLEAHTRRLVFAESAIESFVAEDPAKLDLSELNARVLVERIGLGASEGVHDYASNVLLVDYGPTSYTYLWNLVAAHAVIKEFRQRGLFNPAVARRFREAILEAGASKSAGELLRDFLGRPYRYEDALETF